MRLLLDNNLPPKLVGRRAALGHDAIHVRELPNGDRAEDFDIGQVADRLDRIVVTKDNDYPICTC